MYRNTALLLIFALNTANSGFTASHEEPLQKQLNKLETFRTPDFLRNDRPSNDEVDAHNMGIFRKQTESEIPIHQTNQYHSFTPIVTKGKNPKKKEAETEIQRTAEAQKLENAKIPETTNLLEKFKKEDPENGYIHAKTAAETKRQKAMREMDEDILKEKLEESDSDSWEQMTDPRYETHFPVKHFISKVQNFWTTSNAQLSSVLSGTHSVWSVFSRTAPMTDEENMRFEETIQSGEIDEEFEGFEESGSYVMRRIFEAQQNSASVVREQILEEAALGIAQTTQTPRTEPPKKFGPGLRVLPNGDRLMEDDEVIPASEWNDIAALKKISDEIGYKKSHQWLGISYSNWIIGGIVAFFSLGFIFALIYFRKRDQKQEKTPDNYTKAQLNIIKEIWKNRKMRSSKSHSGRPTPISVEIPPNRNTTSVEIFIHTDDTMSELSDSNDHIVI